MSNFLLIVLFLSLPSNGLVSANKEIGSITLKQETTFVLIAEDKKKELPEPGKDMTDDPHGPSPYGKNPHGRDPHDEIHDKDLPANNPDKYYGGRS